MRMVAAIYRRTHSPSQLACLRVGGHPALSLHSSNEQSELIAIVVVILTAT